MSALGYLPVIIQVADVLFLALGSSNSGRAACRRSGGVTTDSTQALCHSTPLSRHPPIVTQGIYCLCELRGHFAG